MISLPSRRVPEGVTGPSPVNKGTCSYPVLWNTFKRPAAGYSADEKTALFSGAAKNAYRLEV
jgi:hypothetical protein